jgi:hypothetical protein
LKKIVSLMVLAMFLLTFAASAAENAPTVKTEAKAAAENVTKKVEGAAAAAAAGGVAAAEKKVEEKAAETKAAVEKKVETKVAETKEGAANKPAEAAKKGMPGFEGIFAIAGLMAVAYLVLGRK